MLPAILRLAIPPRSASGPSDRLASQEPKGQRADFEFYPTPPEATRALLSVESFDGTVWEPACGQGHMAKVLEAAGLDVVASDLVDHGYGRSGVDFLTQRLPRGTHIVTNPPYGRGLGDAFVAKALAMTAHTGGRVAMLLNIASLCHPDRHDSFMRRPPSRIYALDKCVCFPNGKPEQATRHTYDHRYVWCLWDQPTQPSGDVSNPTELRWLSTAPFTDAALRSRKTQTKRKPHDQHEHHDQRLYRRQFGAAGTAPVVGNDHRAQRTRCDA